MARRAEGWRLTLDRRSGIYGVRWTQGGVRHHESTGERDLAAAQTEAARIYAEAVSGRRAATARVALDALGAEWLADVEHLLDPETVDKYLQYVGRWGAHFAALDRVTGPAIEDYWRARLKQAKRKTVVKELYALTGDGRKAPGLLRWAEQQGHLAEMPLFRMPPANAPGTPTPGHQQETVPLTPAEVARILARLPEWSVRARQERAGGGGRWRPRDRFTVAWETGLRPATLDAIEAPGDYRRGAATLRIRDEHDKSRYGRELPLTRAARTALDRSTPDVGLIFGLVDDHAAANYLRKAARAAGIEERRAGKVKPYDLRHARGTDLAEDGGLVGTAYLLGHRHVTTTDRYVHPHARAAAAVLAGVAAKGTGSGRAGKGTGKRGGGKRG